MVLYALLVMTRDRRYSMEPDIDRSLEPLLDTDDIAESQIETTETPDMDARMTDTEASAIARRLRDLRSTYLPDLDTEPSTDLLDADAVDTEAQISAAAEGVDPAVRVEVQALYQRFISEYEYVKEANDKFLAMLDEALNEDNSDAEEQDAIRDYAESLLLDPINQRQVYTDYEQEDIVDSALDLTNREAWMDVDVRSNELGSDI
ncbi:MAG: hypothetical protein NVS2B14_03340 [Chamaesiphon sp.]